MIDHDIDQYCQRFAWAMDAMSDQDDCLPAEKLQKAISRAKGPAQELPKTDAQQWADQIGAWHRLLAREAVTSPSGNLTVHPSGWVTYFATRTWQEKLRDFCHSVLLWDWSRRTHAHRNH